MGRSHNGLRCNNSDDSPGLLRQADAAAYDGDIRSNGSTDGRCCCRGMGGLPDKGLVGLSALVPAGIGSVDMLVPVSATGYVA